MSIHRALLTLGLCSLLSAAHAAAPHDPRVPVSLPVPAKEALPAKDFVTALKAVRTADGDWLVTIDYEYSGMPENARLEIKQLATRTEADVNPVPYRVGTVPMVKGRHSAKIRLERPDDEVDRFTQQLVAEVWDGRNIVVARLAVPQKVEWPDGTVVRLEQQVAGWSPEQVMRQASGLIDAGDPSALRQGKLLLERLLKANPRLDQAYVELARVAMKQNWGPDGLREAEALIQAALQLRPDSLNASVLLGYVYSNQRRYKEATVLFEQAARAGTDNLWLWANWGEMLLAQGQREAAIAKFREATKHPRARGTNDFARQQAYSRLLQTYDPRKDLDAMDALHRKRRAEYPGAICFELAHARFLVTLRGDAAGADAILNAVPQQRCETGEGRMLEALVRYVAWAASSEPQRAEALRLARVAMPVGPRLFQLLAETDQTLVAARQLVAAGEKVTMQDDQRMDALAYALLEGDNTAAARLLAIGARTDALVRAEQLPVALLPVLAADLGGVALMQRAGVDYTQLRYRGTTAIDFARHKGDEQLLRALSTGSRRL